MSPSRSAILVLFICAFPWSAQSQTTFIKANNNTALNLAGSYTANSGVPGSQDTIQVDGNFTTQNTAFIGGNLSIYAINQTSTAGAQLTIGATANSTLTIGAGGITKSSTSFNLLLGAAISLSANQTWNVGTTTSNSVQLTATGSISDGGYSLSIAGTGLLDVRGNYTLGSNVTISNQQVNMNQAGNTLTLGGNNSFTDLRIQSGKVSGSTIGNFGQASNFGAGGTNTAILLATSGATGTFEYTGSSTSTNRTFSLDPRGTGVISVTTSGQTLTLNGNLANNNSTGNGSYSFTGLGNVLVNSTISNSSNASSFNGVVKNGTGTLTLTGNNTYAGATTLNSGALVLDYGTRNGSKLADGASLVLGGGSLTLTGGNHTEVIASTTLQAGGTTSISRSSGNATLALKAISANNGATVRFASSNITTTDTTNSNGILGGYATVGTTDWATNASNSAGGNVTAYSAYTLFNNPAGWSGLGSAVNVTNDAVWLSNAITSPTTINSLRYNVAGGGTVNANADLTLGSGGLLISSTVTSASALNGSSGLTSSGSNLYVVQNSASDFSIGAAIFGSNALVKSGSGRLILTNGFNSYTGQTYVNEGVLQISTNANLGNQTTGAALNINGGTLQITSNVGLFNGSAGTNNRAVNLGANGATFDTNGNTLTIAGVVADLVSGNPATLTKNGTGSLVLSGSNTYTGSTILNAGTIQVGNAAALGVGGDISFAGGTLQYGSGITTDLSSRFRTTASQSYRIDTNGNEVTFATALTSSGATLDKSGTGNLTLTAGSTYSGNTTITGGGITLGSGGSLAGSISFTGNNTTFSINRTDSPTISNNLNLSLGAGNVANINVTSGNNATLTGAITSSGQEFWANGPGTLIVNNGSNTFNASVVIVSGTLQTDSLSLNGSNSSLGRGGIFIGQGGSTGTLRYTGANATSDQIGAFSLQAATNTIDVTNVATTLTLSANLSQTGVGKGLTKAGNGTLVLAGANTYNGTTTVSAGTLRVANSGALGSGNASVTSGAVLDLNGQSIIGAIPTALNGTGLSSSGALLNSSGTAASLGGLVTISNGTSIGGSGNITLSGGLAATNATNNLIKTGNSTLTLSAAAGTNRSTNTATTQIDAGTIRLSNASGLATGTTAVTTINSGTLEITGGITFDQPVTLNNGSTLRSDGNNTAQGTLTVSNGASTTSSTVSSSDVFTLGNAANDITGGNASSTINIGGPGTVFLNQSSNYQGNWAINSGTLRLSATSGLGNATTPSVSLSTGATLAGFTASTTTFTNSPSITVTGSGTANVVADRSVSGGTVGYVFGSLAIANQTLSVRNTSAFTSGTPSVTFGATTLSGNSTFDVALISGGATSMTLNLGALSDNGTARTITKAGNGTLTLGSNATSLVDGTVVNVNAGTFNSSNGSALGSLAAVNVASGASLGVTTSQTLGSLGGAGSVAITAGQVLTIGSTNNLTSTFSGATTATTGSIVKAGSGNLTLSGNNLHTGGTTINSGTIRATTSTGALGNGALALSGGNLELANDSGLNFARPTTLNSNATITSDTLTSVAGVTHTLGTLGISGQTLSIARGSSVASGVAGIAFGITTLSTANPTFSVANGASLTLGALTGAGFTPTITGAGNVTQTGVWSGAGTGLVFDNSFAGSATLNQANTFTGSVTLNGGTLNINLNGTAGTNGPLGNGGNFTINGGTIDNTSGSARTVANVNPITLGGDFAFSTAAGTASNNLTLPGTVSLGGNRSITTNGGGVLAFSGVVSDGSIASSITKAGSGTLSFGGANTFSGGLVVNSGTVRATGNAAGGNGSITSGAFGTSTLTLAENTGLTWGSQLTVANTQTILTGNVTVGSGSTQRLTWATGQFVLGNVTRTITVAPTDTIANLMSLSNTTTAQGIRWNQGVPAISISVDSGTLRFVGGGGGSTWSGLNNYENHQFTNNSGLSIGSNMLLNFQSATSLGNSASNYARLTVEQGGMVSLSGAATSLSQTVYSLSDGGTAGGTVTNLSTATGTATLTISDGAGANFSGVIADGANVSGTGISALGVVALTKSGSGTQTLSGVNTYSGATAVNGGSLLINGSTAAASTFTVNNGGTLGGNGTIGGNITVASGGTLAPGSASSTGVLTASSSLTLNSGSSAVFQINGTTLGTDYDSINVANAVSYGGNLSLTFGSSFLVQDSTPVFNLFDFTSFSGNFAAVTIGGAYSAGLTRTGNVWSGSDSFGNSFSFSQATGDLSVVAVPEPSTWIAIAACGLLGIFFVRRRLRKA